jgi:signal transduction histidine kinase
MNQTQDSELARLRAENEQLRQALEQCRSAYEKAEQDLTRSLEEGRAATEDMQHLIYAVSHDLRTPLRAIASYTQLLQRQYAADPEAAELSTYAAQGVKEMNTLIEDLLKYSRAGSSPRRSNVSLNTVLQWVRMNLEPKLRETGGQIISGDLPQLQVDESQFVQVLQQLFLNALTFRGEAAPVIELMAEEANDEYILSVRDNGVGIEPQYLELVFQPFKRLGPRDLPGNGLGLPTCKKIVKAHGGRIWAESAGKGQGTTFRFTVPY